MDFQHCDDREALAAYQDLGRLLCDAEPPEALLLKTGTGDSDVHYALRDVLCTVSRILDGRLQLRIAVVGTPGIIELCLAMGPELRSIGCELRLFDQESKAVRWVLAGEPRLSVRAVACGAIP